MILPNRGEVWTTNLDPTLGHEQAGHRPCLIVSANKLNHSRAELVVVVPITTKDKRIPSHVKVPQGEGGLSEDSFIKCEEVRCISTQRLDRPLGKLNPQTIRQVEEWIRVILGL